MNSLLTSLEENLKSEFERQQKLYLALEQQKTAVVSRDIKEIEKSLEALSTLGIEGITLEKERKELVSGLANVLGVAAENLSMNELIKKLGSLKPEFIQLHRDLREIVFKVAEYSKNLGYLVRQYAESYSAALAMIFQAAGLDSPEAGNEASTSGVIVNAEG